MIDTIVRQASEEGAIEEGARLLRNGGLVVFPTDTLYGVGACALLPKAIEALYRVKRRPRDRAIPLLLSSAAEMNTVAKDIPDIAWAMAERFWPGGLTLVLPRAPHLPNILCSEGQSIALRVPDHPVALALIAAAGGPVATTSANRSGEPPATTAIAAQAALGGLVDMILDGGQVPVGVPSTVLDLTSDSPRILRQGAVSRKALSKLLAEFRLNLEP